MVIISAKRRYETIKPGRKGSSGIAITIVIAAVILVVGCFGTIIMMGQAINTVEASSGVVVHISVTGNDLILNIIGGDRVNELEYLFVEISGYELSSSEIGKPVEKGQTEVIYKGFVNKITGNHLVAVRGLFSNGNTAQIVSRELRFS